MLNGIIPSSWAGPALSVLRITTGLLFFAHGSAKLLVWPSTQMFPDGVPVSSFMGFTGLLEFVGGILIVLGLFTRLAAFVLSGMMAVAYFMAHAPQGFHPINNAGELAIMFCFVFLYLAAAGGGPWSLDAKLRAS
jgi:putative oxidoreductase